MTCPGPFSGRTAYLIGLVLPLAMGCESAPNSGSAGLRVGADGASWPALSYAITSRAPRETGVRSAVPLSVPRGRDALCSGALDLYVTTDRNRPDWACPDASTQLGVVPLGTLREAYRAAPGAERSSDGTPAPDLYPDWAAHPAFDGRASTEALSSASLLLRGAEATRCAERGVPLWGVQRAAVDTNDARGLFEVLRVSARLAGSVPCPK